MSTEPSENDPQPAPEVPTGGPKRKVLKKRIPRKHRQEELEQPDEFMEVGGTLVDWLVDRRKVVGPLIGAVLVALLIGALLQSSELSNREDASSALFSATAELPEATSAFASTLSLSSLSAASAEEEENQDEAIRKAAESLGKVGADFAGTPQAGIAHIRAGNALSRIPDYEAALGHFEAAEEAGGVVRETAMSGRAYTLSSLERYDEAIPVFEELLELATGAMKQQLMVDQAKLYANKGDDARAQELFTAFVAEYPDSPLVRDVESRIASN